MTDIPKEVLDGLEKLASEAVGNMGDAFCEPDDRVDDDEPDDGLTGYERLLRHVRR